MNSKKRNRPYPNLRAWRRARGLTQHQAAEQLGLDQGNYSRLERGMQYPQRRRAKAIAEVTGVPIETVLGVE